MNDNSKFDQSELNDFRLQLGILIDNLSSVYHFDKIFSKKGEEHGKMEQRGGKIIIGTIFLNRNLHPLSVIIQKGHQ